jgi:DNA ligase (NAD+)
MEKLNKMQELLDKLNKWNYEYYTLDNPSVSDKQWDKEYNKLLQLEKETNVILPNSPTVKVGGQTLDGFEKVTHKVKLWSLDKAQSFDELKEWLNKNESFVKDYNLTHSDKLPKPEYIISKKFDGLTLKCTYDELNFIEGATRGQGGIEGEQVTEQSKAIINLPLQLNNNDKATHLLVTHGECLMSKKALIEYNKTAKEPLKNCRNGVAGAIRNLDPKETAKRKPMIYFYNINDFESDILVHETYEQQLNYMAYRGLPVAEYIICNTYEEIVEAINNIEAQRPNLPYDIDGAVVAINDLKTREIMGYTAKFPRFSLAYKYEAEETTTKLIDVEWNVSRHGRINPKAIITPVELCGSTVKKATLNNLDDIKRKNVKLNSTVFIRKSNDVIPEITGVVDESLNNSDIQEIIPPSKCPCCHKDTEIIDGFVWCTNIDCDARLVQSITHFTEKQALNIDGFAEKTVETLKERGFIKSIFDIYNLKDHKNEIIKIPKFGIKKYNNMLESIEKSRQPKLSNYIYALGIPNVGEVASKDLAKYFKTHINFIHCKKQDLLKIDGIGETTANSIINYLKTNENLIVDLMQELNVLDDVEKEINVTQQTPFKGKSLYPTGGFNMKKVELKELLESLGAIVETGYKKSLNYLICGHDMSKSNKDKKAMEDNASGKANITILTEDQFIQIIKGN